MRAYNPKSDGVVFGDDSKDALYNPKSDAGELGDGSIDALIALLNLTKCVFNPLMLLLLLAQPVFFFDSLFTFSIEVLLERNLLRLAYLFCFWSLP